MQALDQECFVSILPIDNLVHQFLRKQDSIPVLSRRTSSPWYGFRNRRRPSKKAANTTRVLLHSIVSGAGTSALNTTCCGSAKTSARRGRDRQRPQRGLTVHQSVKVRKVCL